jgi:hypothetical protein
MEPVNKETLNVFADVQHEIWASWMKFLFTQGWDQADGTFKIKSEKVRRWKRQMETSFADLTEEERETDRHVVEEHMKNAILGLIEQAVSASLDNLEEDFVLIEKEGWEDIQETLEILANTGMEGAINDIKGA